MEISELPYQLMDMLSDAVAVLDKNGMVTCADKTFQMLCNPLYDPTKKTPCKELQKLDLRFLQSGELFASERVLVPPIGKKSEVFVYCLNRSHQDPRHKQENLLRQDQGIWSRIILLICLLIKRRPAMPSRFMVDTPYQAKSRRMRVALGHCRFSAGDESGSIPTSIPSTCSFEAAAIVVQKHTDLFGIIIHLLKGFVGFHHLLRPFPTFSCIGVFRCHDFFLTNTF